MDSGTARATGVIFHRDTLVPGPLVSRTTPVLLTFFMHRCLAEDPMGRCLDPTTLVASILEFLLEVR